MKSLVRAAFWFIDSVHAFVVRAYWSARYGREFERRTPLICITCTWFPRVNAWAWGAHD